MNVKLSPNFACLSCGATCKDTSKERKRFEARHGANCKKAVKVTFSKSLADGTKSVGTIQEEDVHLYRLETIEAEGRNLTAWEKTFIADIRAKVDSVGTKLLTDNQKTHLEKVYAERTS